MNKVLFLPGMGIGGVRFGFEVDSTMVYVHEFFHAGLVESVYMHSGTQPIRYEIRSTGGAGCMSHICSSVISEGGHEKTGITSCYDTNGTLISCATGSIQMLLAIRIDKDEPDLQLLLERVYCMNVAANSNFRWVLAWNPTITGTPNWVKDPNFPIEVWRNAGTNITMTGGVLLGAGYGTRDMSQANETLEPSVNPGVSIAGTSDILALGIESIGATSSCSGGLAVRQLV